MMNMLRVSQNDFFSVLCSRRIGCRGAEFRACRKSRAGNGTSTMPVSQAPASQGQESSEPQTLHCWWAIIGH